MNMINIFKNFFLGSSLSGLCLIACAVSSSKDHFVSGSISVRHDPTPGLDCGHKCHQLDSCLQFNISPNGTCNLGVTKNTGDNYQEVAALTNTISGLGISSASYRAITTGRQDTTTGGQVTTTESQDTTTESQETTTEGQVTTIKDQYTTTEGQDTTTEGQETTTAGQDTTTEGPETTTGEPIDTTEVPSTTAEDGPVYCDITAASMPFVAPEDAFIASGSWINGVEWNCLTTGCLRSVEDDYVDFNPPTTNGFDDYFRSFYSVGYLVTFEGANVNYYKWSNYGTRYDQVSSFPKAVNDVFDIVPAPIDAADAYMDIYDNTGNVYLIKSDIVFEYDFTGTSTLSATFLQSFSITSNADHPFNKIPQSPPQMPSGITALHISKLLGKSFAFVGSHFYTHEWGTGTWTYEGRVICPIDP